MNKVRIRAACLDDLPGIEAVEKASFPAARRSSRRALRHSLCSAFQSVWVAETRDNRCRRVVAALVLHHHPRSLRVYSLAVLRGYRGHGLGGRLVRKAIRLAKQSGRTALTLEVMARKRQLVDWYRSFGFVPVTLLHHYYPDGPHGLRMRLEWTATKGGDPHGGL